MLVFLRALDDDCNRFETCQAGYLNGYHWADRLLEDIPFEFRVAPDGTSLVARMASSLAASYYASLNDEKMRAEGVAYALENDIFAADLGLRDQSVVLYRRGVPHRDQAFGCPDVIEIDGVQVTCPSKPPQTPA